MTKKKFIPILLIGLFFAIFLNSCQFLQIPQSLEENFSLDSKSRTNTPANPDTQSLSITSSNWSETPCAYTWASQSLPEESQQMDQLLKQAGFENVRVVAEAFGENCVNAEGQNVRFAVMQTDVRLFVTVGSLSNPAELGELAASLLNTIFQIPATALPGTQPGYVGIQFTSSQQEVLNLWFKRDWAERLLQSGIRGEELLRELQRK
ncbi:hypothetical protein AC812_12905 [Bellilinea caldifistulae]|uniref:Uncharacterized protein n=2 Tax=Bellilinea caldifistulae TaxID=360411 RepID=A0A0P6XG48_9CHLR|nr:hypothetical protein AC812_12905 [Bellilinea caldifistulae]